MIIIVGVKPINDSQTFHHMRDIGQATISKYSTLSSKKQNIANIGTSNGTIVDILGDNETENITTPIPSQ